MKTFFSPFLLRSLAYLGSACVFLVIYLKYLESKSLFFPSREIELLPSDFGLAFEDLNIRTTDEVVINAWFIPQQEARYTILFLHGNGGNNSHRLEKIRLLHQMKLDIFILDYRGYGRSEGRPSEAGLYRDAEAGYRYLREQRRVAADKIIVYGESLGAAVGIELVSKLPAKALILEGAFSNIKDMAHKIYPFLSLFLFTSKFDSLRKIEKIGMPKLFIHSQDDEIVPFSLGQKLYLRADQPKRLLKLRGGHDTSFLDCQEEYVSGIAKFIAEL
jgi:hypothetical protein